MADPDQGQELQHQPVGRRRSCALALVAADAGPLPAKGVGSREAQPAHEVRQENFEEDDHIATESRAAWDLYVYFTCYIYMQEGTRKRRKRRGEERREAGGGHDSREIKTKAREVAWWCGEHSRGGSGWHDEVRCRFAVRRLDFFLFSFCFLFVFFSFLQFYILGKH